MHKPLDPPKTTDRRAVAALLSVVFINIAGFGLVIPLLPFYARAFGAPAWQVTLLFSAFSLGQFVAEPLWGRLSDRIGRRPVMLFTIALNAGLYLALAFAPNLWVALALRLAGGVFSGNISTIQGYMADITPPAERAGKMALVGSAFSLGFVLGPALGALLARPELGAAGFRLPILAAAGLGLMAALAVWAFVREPVRHYAGAPPRGMRAALSEAMRHPVIATMLAVAFVLIAGFAGMEATYGLWAEARFGWGPREIGLAFVGFSVVGATLQTFVVGRLSRRFGEAAVLSAGLLTMCVGMIAQGLAPIWQLAIPAMVVSAVGNSLVFPNIGALVSRASPPERQGEMLGLNMSAGALGRIFGPLPAGPLFALWPNLPFVVAGVIALPALILVRRMAGRVKKAA